MRRRDFIKVIAGSVTAWPLAARAQLAALPVIGLLGSASPDLSADRLRPFRQGLSETGYVEGNNVVIEYRWAEGQNDRLPALAADLVRHKVTVIAVLGNTFDAGSKGGDFDDSDCVCDSGRPRRGRPCR